MFELQKVICISYCRSILIGQVCCTWNCDLKLEQVHVFSDEFSPTIWHVSLDSALFVAELTTRSQIWCAE